MSADLDILLRLQEIDTESDEVARRIEAVRAALGPDDRLQTARAAASSAAATLAAAEQRQRALEWDVEDRSTRIKELEARLYSGSIRNPKELASLQTEIVHLKQALSAVEEQALTAMVECDAARAESVRCAAARQAEEGRWQAEQRALREEGGGLTANLKRLRAARVDTVARVGAAMLARYEELRRTRHGLAVARIDRNTCLGCRTSLPTAQVQAARQGQVVHCSSCDRFLHSR